MGWHFYRKAGFYCTGDTEYMVDAIERMKSGLGREGRGVIPV